MRFQRRAGVRDIVLLIVALAILGAAAMTYRSCANKDTAPSDQYIEFYCPDCDAYFKVSHRDFEEQWNKGEYKILEDKGMLFKCQQCGKIIARRADGTEKDVETKP